MMERRNGPVAPIAAPARHGRIARDRRGLALVAAILGVVVISVLILGGYFTSTQEFRGGRNMLVEQRAFAIAEYGLNNEVSNWDRSRNLLPEGGGMSVGEVDSTRRYVADGDTAFVKVTRLTENTFWVVSEGRANLGLAAMESGRRTNAFVRTAYPSIKPEGAITTAGDVKLTGASIVTGKDTDPPGWGGMCDGIPGGDVPAISHAPGADIDYKTKNIPSTPATKVNAAAADSNTYIRFGTETWYSLAENADVKIPAGASPVGSDILPVGTDTTCVVGTSGWSRNWGEPRRPGVKGCWNRFPIIYSEGDLHLNGKGRGQGILLVNGSLRINGQFEFHGIIVVRDNVEKGNGTAQIYGALYARDAQLGDASFFAGTQDLQFSSCAVENALRGSAILTRVSERHWTQMF